MKKQIKINKKVFIPVYVDKYDYLNNQSRFLVMYGGAGSGKSYSAGQKFVLRMLQEKGHKFLFIRKFATTLKASMYDLMKEIITSWKIDHLFEFRLSPLSIKCIHNGNEILFRGMDDPEKIKSIAGISGVWIEEATELKPEEFEQLNIRIRGKNLKNYVQYVLTFNPVSEHNWIKKRFFDFHDSDASIIHTTYLDNPFLDDAYIKAMQKLEQTNKEYYDVYALGKWGSIGHIVYSNYTVKEFDREMTFSSIYHGADFGFNDPSAFVKVGIKDDEFYILSEIYQTGLTNKEFISHIVNHMDKKKDYLVVDSAEPDRLKEFKQEGFSKTLPTKKGQGSIKTGIDFIKGHKIYIHPSCENFIKEIQSYTYRKDKNGKVYDEPIDANNHLMDALRYALEFIMKERGRKIKAGPSGFRL